MGKWMRPCLKCGRWNAPTGEKYCMHCKSDLLHEMKQSGYLTDTRTPRQHGNHRGERSRSAQTLGGSAEQRSDDDNW